MAENEDNRWSNSLPRINRKHILPYSLIFIIVPSLTFIIGKWLDNVFLLPEFPPFPANLCLGFGVFFPGLALGIKSTRLLYKVGMGLPWGEIDEESRSKRLVTTGPYAYTRNPMTLGYSLLPCGMGLMFQSLGMALIIPAAVIMIMVVWLKIWEEQRLEKRFSETYREYKRRTPFLIPHGKPFALGLLGLILRIGQHGISGNRGRPSLFPFSLLVVSLLGLCIVPVLTSNSPVLMIPLQKQLIGAAFGGICITGIIAGLSPSRCSRILHFRRAKSNNHDGPERDSETATVKLEGHHPTCGNFSFHSFKLGGKTYCAGCSGLIVGALISLVGSALYFFVGLSVGGSGAFVFWLGLAGVACGLLQYYLFTNKVAVHFALNVTFVLGAFSLLVGVSEMSGNLVLELYLIALIVYWITARILLSQWEHKKICFACGLTKCGFPYIPG